MRIPEIHAAPNDQVVRLIASRVPSQMGIKKTPPGESPNRQGLKREENESALAKLTSLAT